MPRIFKDYCECESGATAIEYAILAALIGVGIVGGAAVLGNGLNAGFTEIGTKVSDTTTDFGNT